MSDNEQYAAGFAAGFAAGKEAAENYSALRDYVQQVSDQLASLMEDVNDARLRLRQLERAKMTAAEALQLFDLLKREDPSLNLASFAAQRNLSYDTLRQARSRQKKKT